MLSALVSALSRLAKRSEPQRGYLFSLIIIIYFLKEIYIYNKGLNKMFAARAAAMAKKSARFQATTILALRCAPGEKQIVWCASRMAPGGT